jgi:outer membrane protein OmpA-like peptidoglycan-associated protein
MNPLLNNESTPTSPPSGKEPGRNVPLWIALVVAAVLVLLGAVSSFLAHSRMAEVEREMKALGERMELAAANSQRALERAVQAEKAATRAAAARAEAESEAEDAHAKAESARAEADRAHEQERTARDQALAARQQADQAIQEAERLKREWSQEVDRLQEALSQIAETRRTALGLVMNLGSDYLKFDFDKATLRPENKELLSRIAGILLTSKNYSVNIYGHTDNIGTEEYNQDLSERRAAAVRDYLVEAGIDPDIITTKGFGKSQPLVPGTSPEARAKNRRVEIGIVNSQIRYGRSALNK